MTMHLGPDGIYRPPCVHGLPFSAPCQACNRITNHLSYRTAGTSAGGKISIPTWRGPSLPVELIGQCPGCFSFHSVPPEMDWECDCGEAVTIIDLRDRDRAETLRLMGWYVSEIERLRRIEQLAVNMIATTQPGDFEDAFVALDDAIGGLDG